MTNLLLVIKTSISASLMSLVSSLCKVDDFCLSSESAWENMLIKKEGHSSVYQDVNRIVLWFQTASRCEPYGGAFVGLG